jgi:rhodanese-related sulfurtransferase
MTVGALPPTERPRTADTCSAAPADIFYAARGRIHHTDGAYAGALTPREAWTLLQTGLALLVDVRMAAETRYVGHVPGARFVEWHGKDAPQVATFIDALSRQVAPENNLLFLCRSGVRSHHAAAAATRAGFAHSYNVLEGFEGQRNHEQQRGWVDGWRKQGLPWVQD